MNITLQNYKNLIEKLIEDYINDHIDRFLGNIQGYDINNYISLISSLDIALTNRFKNSFFTLFNEFDTIYSLSIKRKRKYHIEQKCHKLLIHKMR